MDKYASEIIAIAKQLEEIENMDTAQTKTASVKVAGWFTKLFSKGMNEQSKEKFHKFIVDFV